MSRDSSKSTAEPKRKARQSRLNISVRILFLAIIIVASLAYFVMVLAEKAGPFMEFKKCKYEPSRVIHVGVIVDSAYDEYYGRNNVKSEIEYVLRGASQPFLRQVGIEFRVKQVLYPDNSEFSGDELKIDNPEVDKRTFTACFEEDDSDRIAKTLQEWIKERSSDFEEVMTWILFKKCWPAPKDGADSTVTGKANVPRAPYNETQDLFIILRADESPLVSTLLGSQMISSLMHELGHNLGQDHTWCKESYKDLPRNSETGGEGGENCCSSECAPKTDDGYHHGIMDYYNLGGVWAVTDDGSGRPAFHTVHEDSMCQVLRAAEKRNIWLKKSGKFARGIEPDLMYWGTYDRIIYPAAGIILVLFFVELLLLLRALAIASRPKRKKRPEIQHKKPGETEKVGDLKTKSPDQRIDEMATARRSRRIVRSVYDVAQLTKTAVTALTESVASPTKLQQMSSSSGKGINQTQMSSHQSRREKLREKLREGLMSSVPAPSSSASKGINQTQMSSHQSPREKLREGLMSSAPAPSSSADQGINQTQMSPHQSPREKLRDGLMSSAPAPSSSAGQGINQSQMSSHQSKSKGQGRKKGKGKGRKNQY